MSNDEIRLTRNESATIGASSVTVATPGPRRALFYRNSSAAAQVITLNLGNQPAVAGAGIVLSPTQFFIWSEDAALPCWKGGITAIADGAGAILSIFEA